MGKLLILVALLSFGFSNAQRIHFIELSQDNIVIPDRKFYIAEVSDNRENDNFIGIVMTGVFNKKRVADLTNGLEASLQNYFNTSLPKSEGQIPLKISVKKLEISEKMGLTGEIAMVEIKFDYYYQEKLLFTNTQKHEISGIEVTNQHNRNIRAAIKNSVFAFSKSNWQIKIDKNIFAEVKEAKEATDNEATNNKEIESDTESDDVKRMTSDEYHNRNIFSVGHQIGGVTLIGIDYEIRFHDYFGIHFGVGLPGYTAGMKVHTSPSKNSGFFNISYKDNGFGLMSAGAIEYGNRWVWSKTGDFGLHFQVGFAKLIDIDKSYEQALYNNGSAPDIFLTTGIGFSW